MATEPKLIICDEPVSALDVSVQAQILNLLEEMKRRYGLTLVFIAHDLAVVKNVSDKIAVMYLGKLCEFAQPDQLYAEPAHPYTAALLTAIPEPDPDAVTAERTGVGGEIPSPLSPPSGCRFRTRCAYATSECADVEPQMREVRPGHFVACHHPLGDITVRQTAMGAAAPPPSAPPPPAPASPPAPPAPTPAPEPVAPISAVGLGAVGLGAVAAAPDPVGDTAEPTRPPPPAAAAPPAPPPPPPPPRRLLLLLRRLRLHHPRHRPRPTARG